MKKYVLSSFLVWSFFLSATGLQASSLDQYFELVEKYPNFVSAIGDASKKEIEILFDKEKIQEIEKKTGRQVGVIARDPYWIWVNDACRFPSGKEGVYGRILSKKGLEGVAGVAVMPLLPDGRIVLNAMFRHATRSWEVELPRGMIDLGETAEAAAIRETAEETGMIIGQLHLLGSMPPDTGMKSTIVQIYAGKVKSQQKSAAEDSEAIATILFLTVKEVKQAFKNGYYETKIHGKMKRLNFRDPFLAYALLLHEIK